MSSVPEQALKEERRRERRREKAGYVATFFKKELIAISVKNFEDKSLKDQIDIAEGAIRPLIAEYEAKQKQYEENEKHLPQLQEQLERCLNPLQTMLPQFFVAKDMAQRFIQGYIEPRQD